MATESDQVKALQRAILERAQELSAEHVSQGELTRAKIIADAREKIKLMEQKELLAARVHADREYQRQVQASELRIQAELDRNRWGLVQAVMDRLLKQLIALRDDEAGYEKIFKNLLRQGVEAPEPTFLEMGPEIPVDGVWAVFFRDPDGTCLEFIQTPV